MKKSISAFLILVFWTAAYGQYTGITIQEINKADYLKKSKDQKKGAWILLGIGVLAATAGAIEVNPDYEGSGNRTLLLIGGLAMAGASIPAFKASARNKRRAASISFGNQFVPQLSNGNLVNKPGPSLSLKIGL